MRGFLASVVFMAIIVVLAPSAMAGLPRLPSCVDRMGRPITSPNNEQILEWKKSTKNQYLDRGFIQGTLVGVYENTRSHAHLDVFIGNDGGGRTGADTDLEVIYNQEFGAVPNNLKPGMEVIACGDYITSNAATNRYPASPLGAILHWIHKRMGGNHPDGFLMIDGKMYGQMDAPPRGEFFDELFESLFY